jgi:hypothetical protein
MTKVRVSRSWYQMKGLIIRNTHVKSLPPTNQKLRPMIKFLKSRSNSKVKVMVSNERSHRKKYTCNMKALPPTNQRLQPRLKFLKSRSNSKVRGPRSWYQMKGLTIGSTRVKYESPSTYLSKVINKVKLKRQSQGHGIK